MSREGYEFNVKYSGRHIAYQYGGKVVPSQLRLTESIIRNVVAAFRVGMWAHKTSRRTMPPSLCPY
jgi:hypothetical protein